MPVVRRSRRGQHVAAQRAHAAVGVFDARAEEQVQEAREQRVADVAVQPRHRAGLDVVHAVAHHELRAVVQLATKRGISLKSYVRSASAITMYLPRAAAKPAR